MGRLSGLKYRQVAAKLRSLGWTFDRTVDSAKATVGTRTQDLSFTKASLYQLSYGGT